MSYSGTGTFVINSSGQPVVTGTTISSTVFNALTADLATGLSTAVTKDGQTTTTARVPFLFGISSTLTTDATSISTGSIITSGGVGVTKALWVGGLTNIAGAVTLQSTLSVTGGATVIGNIVGAQIQATGDILYFGGTAATNTLLKRVTTSIQARLGDDSAYANFYAAQIIVASDVLYFGGSAVTNTLLKRTSTTILARLGDDSDYALFSSSTHFVSSGLIYMAGTTSAELLLKRSTTNLLVRKGDDSADGGIVCGNLTCTGTVNLGGASGTFANSVTAINGVVTGGT